MKVLSLLIILCSCTIIKHKASTQKYTIILDFDDTFYRTDSRSYGATLTINSMCRAGYDAHQMYEYIKTNKLKTTGLNNSINRLKSLQKQFNLVFTNEDLYVATKRIFSDSNEEMNNIIRNIVSAGHRVIIIGGTVFGCAIIPNVVEKLGIKKEDVYSGYYKDLSIESLNKLLSRPWAYVNCANPDIDTVFSEKKSDIVKLLKQQNKIDKHTKIIHIGDGQNDVEVYTSGQADMFIGFGIHRIDKIVEKEAPIFVRSIDEFKKVINQYFHLYAKK